MNHPLESKVRDVARRARSWMLVYGLGWCVAVVLGAAFLVGLADYLFRLDQVGVRVLALSALVGVFGWAIWRFVYPLLQNRWDPVAVAQRIERRFPELRDSLSSSMAFLNEGGAGQGGGSSALRAVVVAETTRAVERLDLRECIDSTGPRRAAGIAVLIGAVVGAACLLDLDSAQLAARRLLLPWQEQPWPRWNQLAWVDPPARLAEGSDFEIALIDQNGRLPDEVTIEFRWANESRTWSRPMTRADDQMTARLENVAQPFAFRAYGGDDELDWRTVEVVQPARIVSARAIVTPPAYTARAAFETQGDIQAVAGSTVRFEVEVSKPLDEVVFRADFAAVPRIELAEDGRRFVISSDADGAPWRLEQSGDFWFELTDREGARAESQRRYHVQVAADDPPRVELDLPTDDAVFTADAMVPVRATVRDDHAIQRVTLYVRDAAIELFSRESPLADDGDEEAGELRVVEYSWDLSAVNLTAGELLEFYVEAADFVPQTGQSSLRRLELVTPEELQRRLARISRQIRARVEEARRTQSAVRDQAAASLSRLDQQRDVERQEVDALQSAEIHQRQVARALGSGEGAAALAESLLEGLRNNRLDDAEPARRAAALLEELRIIQEERLPAVQNRLSSAAALARQAADEGRSRRDADLEQLRTDLREALADQQTILAAIDQLLSKLSQWDSIDQFSRETGRLLETQDELISETAGLETVGKAWSELTDAERSRLTRMAQRQRQVADQFDRLLDGMRDVRREAAASDPALSSDLGRALDAAGEQAALEARQAAADLERNRIGQAASSQREARGGLQRMLDSFPGHAAERDEQFAQVVQRLADRQRQVISETEELERQQSERNSRNGPELTAAARQIAATERKVAAAAAEARERFTLDKPVLSRALIDAETRMGEAAEALQQGLTGAETQLVEQRALDRLNQLAAALLSDRRQESRTRDESPDAATNPNASPSARTLDPAELEMLRLWQADVRQRTEAIDEIRADQPESPAADDDVSRLAEEQRQLADTAAAVAGAAGANGSRGGETPADGDAAATTDLDKALQQADIPGFADELPPPASRTAPRPNANPLPAPRQPASQPGGEDVGSPGEQPLGEALRGMESAASRLRQRDTSPGTQRIQQQVVEQLSALLSSQRPSPGASESRQTAANDPPENGRPGATRDGDPQAGSERSQADPAVAAEAGSSRSWRRVWGQLPDRVREQILNPDHEEFLPEYEGLIQEYYRRLAEQGEGP